ncbi:1-deoxy-D-xylulose-5-phosphate synthase [Euzebya tangerina]|uniref:1-deoxy-D-xylulose-5-phosphate synthase n=1 Tax=Euzebya tangerina TaxID=591198 RepID=UPI000E3147A2|nr:1-deoxy-D-xylulose-5-phosphate synthase [Euzebya tangerina]
MVLNRIDGPQDLKSLTHDDLLTVAEELRTFIVSSVAKVGGHLGSNLGAVELTLALHRVFDSPRDTILWDTGHQAYVHKIVTGRMGLFDQLRQAGGLSGYPSRAESEHDIIENSHASTSLSWAFGLAKGRSRDDGQVIAVIGDGALTGGMAYEALNTIGHLQVPVVIVLNDNGRSYDKTVSRLASEVSRVRLSGVYRAARRAVDPIIDRVPYASKVADAGLGAVKAVVADDPALQGFVEALGIHYLGPVGGHDFKDLEHALRVASAENGPVLVHVLTQKGKGYAPAETDREKKLHDTSAFDIATGRGTKTKPRSWTQAFSDVLLDVMDANEDVVAMTAAMPGSTGLLPCAARHPERVIDVGIAEQHMVTSAAGLAHQGKIPVVAVYSTFFSRAFDQANLDVGLHDEHVVFCFDRAGITGDDGASHHGVLDLSLCLRIPAMTVFAPSSEQELVEMLHTAVTLDGPVSLRWPKYAAAQRDTVGSGLAAHKLREGTAAAVVAIGDRVEPALVAAEALAEDGVDVAVWDPRVIRPVDGAMLDDLRRYDLVITVENGYASGGAGAHIADRLVELTGVMEAPRVLRLGVPDGYIQHAKPDHILAELGLDAAGIEAGIRKTLGIDAA